MSTQMTLRQATLAELRRSTVAGGLIPAEMLMIFAAQRIGKRINRPVHDDLGRPIILWDGRPAFERIPNVREDFEALLRAMAVEGLLQLSEDSANPYNCKMLMVGETA